MGAVAEAGFSFGTYLGHSEKGKCGFRGGKKHRARATMAALQREHIDAKFTARQRGGIGAASDIGATTAR